MLASNFLFVGFLGSALATTSFESSMEQLEALQRRTTVLLAREYATYLDAMERVGRVAQVLGDVTARQETRADSVPTDESSSEKSSGSAYGDFRSQDSASEFHSQAGPRKVTPICSSRS